MGIPGNIWFHQLRTMAMICSQVIIAAHLLDSSAPTHRPDTRPRRAEPRRAGPVGSPPRAGHGLSLAGMATIGTVFLTDNARGGMPEEIAGVVISSAGIRFADLTFADIGGASLAVIEALSATTEETVKLKIPTSSIAVIHYR